MTIPTSGQSLSNNLGMRAPHVLYLLPAHVINGITLALGLAMIEAVVGTYGGSAAALNALGGAIFAGLGDVPNAPGRTWRRTLTTGLMGCAVNTLANITVTYTPLMGVFTMLVAFCSVITLAWGARAGPFSYVGILAMVFAMAAPPERGIEPIAIHCGLILLGALLYLIWAMATSILLQPRLRTLALAGVFESTADLLRSRARLLQAEDPTAAPVVPPLQAWIEGQARLDERLQTARDLLFAAQPVAPGVPGARRKIALLLLMIDLRDTLMVSELDLDALGHDELAEQVRGALLANMEELADVIDDMAEGLRLGQAWIQCRIGVALSEQAPVTPLASPDPRIRLAGTLVRGAKHMVDDLRKVQDVMQGAEGDIPLDHASLQMFVSPEGWPLPVLKRHLTLASPVMRQAIRASVALGSAYFIGQMLPWSSHPYWLVLSVAVVLRGNLEQTLSRRDARVLGTIIGCLVVLGLSQIEVSWLSTVAFMAAAGTSHAYLTRRYLITAAAATVTALLQAHLAYPEGGFDIGERLSDTVLGALLAWGFSYVLPWWERRSLVILVPRVQRGLTRLAEQALRWPEASVTKALELRLARREVYEAIGSIAATAQRTGAEPVRVQVPLYALATLLVQCHVLLAQLAAIRLLLSRRAPELDRAQAEPALTTAFTELGEVLGAKTPQALLLESNVPSGDAGVPPPSGDELQPWLERRLAMTMQAAVRVAHAAQALREAGEAKM